MKKRISLNEVISACLFIIFLMPFGLSAQNQYTGDWEGKFMSDFNITIHLNYNTNNEYSSSLRMFSGGEMIQNDEISKIEIDDLDFKFYLEAKQTEFVGQFNKDFTELLGEFTFPDGSKHPLHVFKKPLSLESKNNSLESYLDFINKKYSVNELQTDFRFLTESLIEYHPQLYYYTSKESMNDFWSRTLNKINSELTLAEFYVLIAPVTDIVNCSHTAIRIQERYRQLLAEYGNFFPLELAFINNKAYYLSNHCNTSIDIKPGSEIITINSMDIPEIMEKIITFMPSEGDNQTTKYSIINSDFNSYYFFLDNSDSFEIEFLSENNQKNTINISACSLNDFISQKKLTGSVYPVDFMIKNDVGFLKVESFAIPDIGEYIQLLDSIFKVLKDQNTQNLVIDLRNNIGGHPIFAAQLLSYLVKDEFTYFKRNPDISEFEPLYNLMQPNPNIFEGNVYMFINGGCLSTTGHFISLSKYLTDTKFIGEAPGSTYRCNDFSTQITLPNTGIEVNIPRTTFETAVSGVAAKEKFEIDYPIEISIKDILRGKDSYEIFLSELLSK